MLDDRTIATPNPDVVCTETEGCAVLLHLATQTYFRLNATGLEIWRSIERGLTLADVGRRLESAFEVDRATARASVLRLAAELAKEDLVSFREAEGDGEGTR